jgi:D-3-phosphoglycerate dehydrogenase
MPSRHMLFTRHRDMPGIIGNLGTVLGEHNVNIASMQAGPPASCGGDAARRRSASRTRIPASLLATIHAINGIQEYPIR